MAEDGVEKRKKKRPKHQTEEPASAAPEAADAPSEEPQKQKKKRKLQPEEAAEEAEAPDNSKKKESQSSQSGEGEAAPGPKLRAQEAAGRGSGTKGKGKGKDGGRNAPETSKPSALKMLRPKAGRHYTVSVALPASIVENCQTWELKALMVGQIARALTIFSVNEIVLFEDRADAPKAEEDQGVSKGLAFFARNLQYLETPQYLRRQLLPIHRDTRHVGILAPLDAPHHCRKYDKLPYREGAVLSAEKAPREPGRKGETGVWVNCGLEQPVWVSGSQIPPDVRITVRLEEDEDSESWHSYGVAVKHTEPTTKIGMYWGYQTRIASNLKAVFDECPYEGGYDFSLGTSERGEAFGVSRIPKFKHMLIAFGGLAGLEDAVSDKGSGYEAGSVQPRSLFSRYVNVCPKQTSRTIRSEEALLITLAALSPHLPDA